MSAPVGHPPAQPAVDLVTERVGVVLQDRPVVSLSAWLSDAIRAVSDDNRALQVVTPATSRLTMALRLKLMHPDSRWVVREPDGGGYYDGLTGVVLGWDGERFAPTLDENGEGTVSPSFAREPSGLGWQLLVTARVRHAATASTVVGGAVAALVEELTGASPAGWGTAEPVSQPWREADLTVFARNRAPAPTWLTIVGSTGEGVRPMVGSVETHRVPSGLDEAMTVCVSYPDHGELPVDSLSAAVDRLAGEYGLVSFLAQAVRGPRDLTSVPHWVGLPAPVGVAVGQDGVRGVGLEVALAPPDQKAIGIGGAEAPGVYYPLGDGRDQAGWTRYVALLEHLGVPGAETDAG